MIQKINLNKTGNIIYHVLLALIIGFGLFLRLKQYFCAYIMWGDEIWIYENIALFPFSHCLEGLNSHQMAPPLWLFLNKLILNGCELDKVLHIRIMSIILGCATMIIFPLLLNKVFKNKIAILSALFLFAVNAALIRYSAEFKHYIGDVFFLLLIFLFYDKIDFSTPKKFVLWLLIFFIMPFASFTTLIVFCAVLLNKIVEYFLFNEHKIVNYLKIVLLGGSLLIAAYILYKINSGVAYCDDLKKYWANGYISQAISLWEILMNFFIYLKIKSKLVLIVIFLSTALSFFTKNSIIRLSLFTFLLTILASLMHLYPFFERSVLFLVPVFIFFIVYIFDIEYNFKINKYFIIIIKLFMLIYLLFISINIIEYTYNVMYQKFGLLQSVW